MKTTTFNAIEVIGCKERRIVMEEREKKILENFAILIPKLSEADKSYLLGLGEGMMIKVEMPKKEMMKTTA
mgnify:CR=1 FL=1